MSFFERHRSSAGRGANGGAPSATGGQDPHAGQSASELAWPPRAEDLAEIEVVDIDATLPGFNDVLLSFARPFGDSVAVRLPEAPAGQAAQAPTAPTGEENAGELFLDANEAAVTTVRTSITSTTTTTTGNNGGSGVAAGEAGEAGTALAYLERIESQLSALLNRVGRGPSSPEAGAQSAESSDERDAPDGSPATSDAVRPAAAQPGDGTQPPEASAAGPGDHAIGGLDEVTLTDIGLRLEELEQDALGEPWSARRSLQTPDGPGASRPAASRRVRPEKPVAPESGVPESGAVPESGVAPPNGVAPASEPAPGAARRSSAVPPPARAGATRPLHAPAPLPSRSTVSGTKVAIGAVIAVVGAAAFGATQLARWQGAMADSAPTPQERPLTVDVTPTRPAPPSAGQTGAPIAGARTSRAPRASAPPPADVVAAPPASPRSGPSAEPSALPPPAQTKAPEPRVEPPARAVHEPDGVRESVDQAEAAIFQTITMYARALSNFDIDGMRAIWPNLDEQALEQDFAQLRSIRVGFDRCDIQVIGVSASASCLGRVALVLREGNQGRQVETRRWQFAFTRDIAGWRITEAEIQ